MKAKTDAKSADAKRKMFMRGYQEGVRDAQFNRRSIEQTIARVAQELDGLRSLIISVLPMVEMCEKAPKKKKR